MPQIKKFIESGGAVLTIGTSTALAPLLGVPVTDHLRVTGTDGAPRALKREEFYIPGSLLRMNINAAHPLAHGVSPDAVVFFDSSPVFKPAGSSVTQVAGYGSNESLMSGWAWGQQYLKDGAAIVEATMGEGKVILYGPEVAFRGQPHGTFKLLFNGIFFGSTAATVLP